MPPVVAEEEPLAGGNLDGPEIVLIPIFFINAEDAVGAQAGRQEALLAGEMVLLYVFVREREIDDLGISGYRIGKPRVVPDGVAVAAIHLEDVHGIEVLVGIDAVDKQDPLPDLEHVAGQAAQALDEPCGAAVGWRRPEAHEAKPLRFSEAGGDQQSAARPGRAAGIETRKEGRHKNGLQSDGFRICGWT